MRVLMTLGSQVEQLVAEKKLQEAYDLLVEMGCVPEGNGHHARLPFNLEVLVQVDDSHMILKSPTGRYWAWDMPIIKKASKYDAYWATHGLAFNQARLDLFLEISPTAVFDIIHALPEGKGRMVGKNVSLIHPNLGAVSRNHIYEFYKNQLQWIAQKWAELCGWNPLMMDANDQSPLFIGNGEFGTWIITQKGKIIDLSENAELRRY